MKRKVLIIIENSNYPFDPRVRNEAQALLNGGFEVTVLCPRDRHCSTIHEVIDGIRVYRHPNVELGRGRIGYFLEYGLALFWECLYSWWIYLRHGFQVIQGCNPPDTIFMVALPFKLMGVRYIFDHHDVNPELYESKYNKRGFLYKVLVVLERLTYRFSDIVIATNESYRDLALSRGGLAAPDVFIVRNGPKEGFKAVPCNPARKHGKAFLVGYVGNMDVQDGLDILLEAALRVKQLGRTDVHFTCVGGGPQLTTLRKMVREKGLAEMVDFTGRVSDEDLLETLSAADLCVNPDKPCEMNDISTMIKIMEYMALGKPIVQFNSKEGKFSAQEASLYADPNNPINDFAEKILWLLDRPELRMEMGEFGRNRVEKELGWKHSVPNLLAAYRRAFGEVKRMSDNSEQGSPILNKVLSDYYKTPPLFSETVIHCSHGNNASGFFRFGPDLICYGECSTGVAESVQASLSFDAYKTSKICNSEIYLPFDISRTIDNLRMERYADELYGREKRLLQSELIRSAYYFLRANLPTYVRRCLQRAYFHNWEKLAFPRWPVDTTVDSLHEVLLRAAMQAHGYQKVPFIWFWPEGASACLILTHDVETASGRDFTPGLMDIDWSHEFRSSFQVVPENRYEFTDSYVSEIRSRGFEFNLHDLNHDGNLFKEESEFLRRAAKINEYVKQYSVQGFRSGSMYRRPEWFNAFEFSYDMSVPNVAHLEPQRGGCCTVFPYFNGRILEIPLTTSQDYTVFQILNERSLELWEKQFELILQRNGLVSILTHPDYLIDPSSRKLYNSLLIHLREIVEQDKVWATLPRDLDRWWRARAAMRLVQDGNSWRIEGPESERARIAYATLDGDRIVYSIGEAHAILK